MTTQPDPTLEAALGEPTHTDILLANGTHKSRWRHVRRGGTYKVIGSCLIEAVNKPAYLYQDEATGIVWARPMDEFLDGRFERLPEAPPATLQGEGETKAVEITGKAISDALQTAWDDWSADTGCFPECFTITRGPKLWADFRLGNFAQHVALHLSAGAEP